MKIQNTILILMVSLLSFSCGNDRGANKEISNKKEYLEIIKAINKCIADFNDEIISKEKYTEMMENFGDVLVNSVDVIPPERRYKVSISCYEKALKYTENSIELKAKLQKQKKLFQVANH